MTYSIGEISRNTGLPASTLRYYETEHLLRPIRRDGSNRRIYDDQDMDWIAIITCLKNTGMPIQEIRRFVELCGRGDDTLQERCRMLEAHRQATEKRLEALQQELEHVNRKVAFYQAACAAAENAQAQAAQ